MSSGTFVIPIMPMGIRIKNGDRLEVTLTLQGLGHSDAVFEATSITLTQVEGDPVPYIPIYRRGRRAGKGDGAVRGWLPMFRRAGWSMSDSDEVGTDVDGRAVTIEWLGFVIEIAWGRRGK
jgi:hypothetical protein